MRYSAELQEAEILVGWRVTVQSGVPSASLGGRLFDSAERLLGKSFCCAQATTADLRNARPFKNKVEFLAFDKRLAVRILD
jgi:hypothetical protein